MTAVEDLDEWHSKSVGLTESAEISSLEKYAQYALAVAAKTKTVSTVGNRQLARHASRVGCLPDEITGALTPRRAFRVWDAYRRKSRLK
jgi:hypothetical protein